MLLPPSTPNNFFAPPSPAPREWSDLKKIVMFKNEIYIKFIYMYLFSLFSFNFIKKKLYFFCKEKSEKNYNHNFILLSSNNNKRWCRLSYKKYPKFILIILIEIILNYIEKKISHRLHRCILKRTYPNICMKYWR